MTRRRRVPLLASILWSAGAVAAMIGAGWALAALVGWVGNPGLVPYALLGLGLAVFLVLNRR